MVREPLARVSTLSGGWSEPSNQEAPAERQRSQPRAAVCRLGGERDVLDGLRLERAVYGRRLRALTVVDAFTREALAIDVDQGIKGKQVVAAMTQISSIRGAPRTIRVDNRPEFISKARSLGV